MKKFLVVFLAISGLVVHSSALLAESVSIQMRVDNSSKSSIGSYAKSVGSNVTTPHVSVIIIDNIAPKEVKPLTSFLLNKLQKQHDLRKRAETFRVNRAMLVRKTKKNPNGNDNLVVLSPQNDNKLRVINRSASGYLQEYNNKRGTNYVSTCSTSPRMYMPHISVGRLFGCNQQKASNRVRTLNNSIASGAMRRSQNIALNRFESSVKAPNGKIITAFGKPGTLRKPTHSSTKSFRKPTRRKVANSKISSQNGKGRGFSRNRSVRRPQNKAPGAAIGKKRMLAQNGIPKKHKSSFLFFWR